jgi:predicted RNA-binding protein with PUA-like domain
MKFLSITPATRRRQWGLRALGGAYPDPSQKNPRMLVVDIEAVKPLPRAVTLAEVKANKKLANFDLVRLSRLSIMEGLATNNGTLVEARDGKAVNSGIIAII